MADALALPLHHRWIIVLCIAAILLGLAAHLAADVTRASPDLLSASGQPARTCRLLANSALPAIAILNSQWESSFAPADPSTLGVGWAPVPPALPSPLSILIV